MNLLIIGAPGAGKGTMSNFLIDQYNLVHISTGDMLREAMRNQTPLGLKVKECMDSGMLVSDEIIHDIIVERLNKDDIQNGFLFDGYPRTVAQAIDLESILKQLNKKIDAVLNLQLSDDVIIKRITGRRTCSKCGAIYNVYFNAPKIEDICDVCGEALNKRGDDNEESLKVRLFEFNKNTKPVVDFYEKQNIVYNIDAAQDVDGELKDIQKVLEGLK